ncbi:hypothetical protein AVEN_241605-1 [Araneus ventricosus]|uniref:Uncharacterized protein n=1 Tax=Araneus ventricosus TaxID=182803 RepID=A0A4Y2T5Y2_ARAVE|nr:hypothetical protein AVEN_241605-1 [Araneus ventricosus]
MEPNMGCELRLWVFPSSAPTHGANEAYIRQSHPRGHHLIAPSPRSDPFLIPLRADHMRFWDTSRSIHGTEVYHLVYRVATHGQHVGVIVCPYESKINRERQLLLMWKLVDLPLEGRKKKQGTQRQYVTY